MSADTLVSALIGPAVLLVLGWLLNRKIDHVKADTSATRYQVQNSHSSNLREDIDAIRDDISHVHGEVRETRRDISGLRDDDAAQRNDVALVRKELRDQARRLDAHIDGVTG